MLKVAIALRESILFKNLQILPNFKVVFGVVPELSIY